MMEWDSRMKNNQSVKILKAAIPFLDVGIGEQINIEGLLGAVRPFSGGRERQLIDLFLQFFQMRRMFDMMQLVQSMQQMQEMAGGMSENGDSDGGQENATEGGNASSMGMPSPEMLSMIKAMVPKEQQEMVDSMAAMVSMMQPQPEKQEDGNEEMNEPEPVDI